MDGIRGFENKESRFLSNFWPCRVYYKGIIFPSSEHAYQAMKVIDPTIRQRIADLSTPAKAKFAGRELKCRNDWHFVKDQVMLEVVRIKFFDNTDLGQRLIDTDTLYLEETNTWGDTYWGVCKGVGQNKLGHILMKVRDELQCKPL